MRARKSTRLTPLDLGREVRRRRQALGLTLEQLAERSGLTPNYIGTVEHGRRDPSLSTISALAKGLETSPADLFGRGPELTAAAVEVAQLFDAAPADVQGAVTILLRAASNRRRR